jgi:hypothetical protein
MMTLLEKEQFDKLLVPLKRVTINHLFARSVLEQCIPGNVYVDNKDEPQTFYVVHPYGMSLLFGNSANAGFNRTFKEYALNINKSRNKFEWMQAFPGDWEPVLKDLFGDRMIKSFENKDHRENEIVELNTRINFKFNIDKYLEFKKKNIVENLKIVRTTGQMFMDMKGSVIPYYFWNSAEEFCDKGVGFSLLYNDQLASTAYAAFIFDNQLEIGIETSEAFRDRGFAQYTCSKLIDYCIDHNYEPVWACRLENTGSYKLAQKLGFEPTAEIPYYRLGK